MSLGDLYSYCIPIPGYGLPGERADDDNGVSAHADRGLSENPDRLVMIGRDNGLSCVGYRCSKAIREVGELSLKDVLKVDFENPLGGVLLSLPRLASNFCRSDLS